jgi:uncharacterized protein YndB with AHSA1/START domain
MVDLNHQIRIAAPVAVVYAAVATEAGMRGWWTRDTTLNPTVGGKAEFGFAKRSTVFRMIVEALDSNRRVRMNCSGDQVEWAGTYLEWRVEAVEGGTLLSLRHGDWKAQTDYCISCNTMWGNLMFKLKAYVESGIPQPQWTE